MSVFPEAVLLDLDGTLVDSEAFHTEAIVRYLTRRGLQLTDEERAFVIGHAWQDIHRHLAVEARIGVDLETLRAGAIAEKPAMMADGFRIEVLEGAVDFVHMAHGLGIPLAIVSGSSRVEIEHALELLGIGERLHFYLGTEDYPRGKPAPDGYLMGADKIGARASRCLVFEDSTAGIASALNAGMRVVATAAAIPGPGEPGHQDQSRAHRVVGGMHEVDEGLLRALMEFQIPSK